MHEHFRFTADPGQQLMRIDQWLRHKMANISRNRIQKILEAEGILVNEVAVRSNYRVKPGDEVKVMLPFEQKEFVLIPEDLPIDVVYEDDDLLVVNKEAGMVVHPGFNNFTGTLVNALVYRYNNLPQKDIDHRPGLVHRIDKDTSGLLVVGKRDTVLAHLGDQFMEHSIHRRYLALIWGEPKEEEFTIKNYMARDFMDRRRMRCHEEPGEGKHAITHVKIIEKFYFCTLVECRLETGRTHQIRVKLSNLGHPLFSDFMYGGTTVRKGSALPKFKQFIDNAFKVMPIQALHAAELGFVHPTTGEKMMFKQELQEDFTAILEKVRAYVAPKY